MEWLQVVCIVICAGCLLVFVVTAAITIHYRDKTSIRERTYILLLISGLGNLANAIVTAANSTLLDNESIRSKWIGFYLAIISEYVFFAPYMLRAYHIKVCFIDFVTSASAYERRAHRLRPRWYLRRFLIGLLLLCLIPISFGVWEAASLPVFPYCFGYSESNGIQYLKAAFIIVHFLQVFFLMVMVYRLRHVYEPYSLNSELKAVCVCLFLVSCIDSPQWELSDMSFLVVLGRDSLILLISNVWPLFTMWNETLNIIPTKETIRDMNFAFEHAETLLAFRQFLHETRCTLSGIDLLGSTRPSLTIDGESCLWFIIEYEKLKEKPSRRLAEELLKLYVEAEDSAFPASIAEDTRKMLRTAESKQAIVDAFSPAAVCAYSQLERLYNYHFVDSTRFQDLERRVVTLNRLLGNINDTLSL